MTGREATVSSCRNCRAVIYRDRVGWLHENGWTDCAGGPDTQAEPGRTPTPWDERPLFALDADVTVYWPDVRPCYEDDDVTPPARKTT